MHQLVVPPPGERRSGLLTVRRHINRQNELLDRLRVLVGAPLPHVRGDYRRRGQVIPDTQHLPPEVRLRQAPAELVDCPQRGALRVGRVRSAELLLVVGVAVRIRGHLNPSLEFQWPPGLQRLQGGVTAVLEHLARVLRPGWGAHEQAQGVLRDVLCRQDVRQCALGENLG